MSMKNILVVLLETLFARIFQSLDLRSRCAVACRIFSPLDESSFWHVSERREKQDSPVRKPLLTVKVGPFSENSVTQADSGGRGDRLAACSQSLAVILH